MNNEKESAWLEEFDELEEMARSRNSLQPLAMTCIYDALTYIYMDYSIDVKDIVSGLCNEPYGPGLHFLSPFLCNICNGIYISSLQKTFLSSE